MEIKDRELHRIALTAIIHKDGLPAGQAGKYLLVRRNLNKKAFPGKWTVPGGGLEVDDYINSPKTTHDHWYFALENTLKREVREEAGLEIGKANYLLDMTFIRPDGIPVVILSYYASYESGTVKLNEENIDSAWVSFEEAKNYDMVEGLLEEIGMVEEILKNK